MKLRIFVTGLLLILLGFSLAYAGDKCCQLPDDKKELARQIMSEQHLYDCCDKTIEQCLNEKPPCHLATRMANQICRLIASGMDKKQVERELAKRASTMMPSLTKAKINPTGGEYLGDEKAPVILTAYLCLRCPYCSKLLPQLHKEITQGRLKGKVRLLLKPFPIKGHPGSAEAGIAAMAAQQQGKMIVFYLTGYRHYDDFSPDKLAGWAKETGLDETAYAKAVADPKTRDALVASKKEGILNKVTATPTLFINGRRIKTAMDIKTLVDLIEEENERLAGKVR